jgi:3-hydroxybutyryl-CoA dehydrogenase
MVIRRVFVVGAGYMGAGIAQVCAQSGYEVLLHDISEERLSRALRDMEWSLGKLVEKGKVNAETAERALKQVGTTTSLEDASGADLVVEAVPEDLSLKRNIFSRLDSICRPDAILATNTSALPITSIASATARPERVVGTHFFGPVPLMGLCEVVRGLRTAEEVFRKAGEWARSLGKKTVMVTRDHAGFVANRVNIPGTLEAIRMVEEGFASPEDVDRASGGFERGVGPLQIVDNAGLEVTMNASLSIYYDTRDPVFLPPPLLRRLVQAGLLGRKAGRGFYDYSSGERRSWLPAPGRKEGYAWEEVWGGNREELVRLRLFLPAVCEGVRVVEWGVASPGEVDTATRLGFNLPFGPLEAADQLGLDHVLEKADRLHRLTLNPAFLAPPLLRRMVAAGLTGAEAGRGFYDYRGGERREWWKR